MKFLDLAFRVLSETKIPMSSTEIWEFATKEGYTEELDTKGKTPEFTLSARLYSSATESGNGKFASIGVRPKRFYLPSITPENVTEKFGKEQTEQEVPSIKHSNKEKDLHCLLSYFIKQRLDAFSKTINHSVSSKKGFGEWTHPDMVACYFPKQHWKTDVYDLSQLLGEAQLGFFSFEIKQKLSFSNLRESFFQAVSNSSWAHSGYLAAADIDSDADFRLELGRLSRAFGIGVILLSPSNPDESDFIYESDLRGVIDWDTVNKLAIQNRDFADFINRVKKDMTSKEIREDWYDQIMESEEIVQKLKSWGSH